MSKSLTPKQVARALEVSESSIKRWCDNGDIQADYTAGGHRKISLASLLSFLREGKHRLVNPGALGLPASGSIALGLEQTRNELAEALIAGHEHRCRQIIIDLYLAERSVSAICDEVIAAAFGEIGDRWECGEAEIYQERMGCEISGRLLNELRSLQPPIPEGSPVAIGGTPVGDRYKLGTAMAELVLREAKWQALSLGDNLPFETLAAAIKDHQPKLFWLSCSYLEDVPSFLEGYEKLHEEFGADVAIVVGGRALDEKTRRHMKFAAHCDSMQHLEGFAETLMNVRR